VPGIDYLKPEGDSDPKCQNNPGPPKNQRGKDTAHPALAIQILEMKRPPGQPLGNRAQEFTQDHENGKNERVMKLPETINTGSEKWSAPPEGQSPKRDDAEDS
jgi:hypothetical protein